MLAAFLPWLFAAALLTPSASGEGSASYPPPSPPQHQDSAPSSAAADVAVYPWPQRHAPPPPYRPQDGYTVQTGYEGYLVPSLSGPTGDDSALYANELLPLFGGVGVAWAAAAWLAGHAAALALGALLALGACKLTPLCDGGWLGTRVEHLRALGTPEQLARAAGTLRKALDKYGERARTTTE